MVKHLNWPTGKRFAYIRVEFQLISHFFPRRRYVNESGKTTEVAKLQSQNKYLEQKAEVYCQRLKDLADVVSKGELDRLLMRYGIRDILELPQQENGIGNHVANINGSNTPDLGTKFALKKTESFPICSFSLHFDSNRNRCVIAE